MSPDPSCRSDLWASLNISYLPRSERLALARARADKLVHHLVPLFLMHESNAVVIYSQKLSSKSRVPMLRMRSTSFSAACTYSNRAALRHVGRTARGPREHTHYHCPV